jgi:hypothetical protein
MRAQVSHRWMQVLRLTCESHQSSANVVKDSQIVSEGVTIRNCGEVILGLGRCRQATIDTATSVHTNRRHLKGRQS